MSIASLINSSNLKTDNTLDDSSSSIIQENVPSPHLYEREAEEEGDSLIKQQIKFNQQSIGIRDSLPTAAFKNEILSAVEHNFVTIIIGETGSGKSTQIPQYLLDDQQLTDLLLKKKILPDTNQLENRLRICVTQPRRVAAIAMARRVAIERSVVLGREIGYAIRFDDKSSKELTQIKYVTDGVALREVLEYGNFNKYQIFIVDEAHERSLNTDILFSLIKKSLDSIKNNELPPIRFIITSATLETTKFSSFFNNSPVIHISGRCFPVNTFYSPVLRSLKLDKPSSKQSSSQISSLPSPLSLVDAAVNAALRLHILPDSEGGGDGHILVFLTGRAECDIACEMTLERLTALISSECNTIVGDAIVLPLYGALTSEDQSLVFEPAAPGCRKIIFATNVAETSVTIEGIKFVIDMGLKKQKLCNPKTGVETLSVVWVSKSEAIQRAGRAGRSTAGSCFRIYAEEQFDDFLDTPVLEIHRTNLNSVVLQLKALGLEDVLSIQFLDPPSKEALLSSLKQLFLLEALAPDGKLTVIGQRMVSLPLDPSHARCLLAGLRYNVSDDIAKIVAMLSVENIWIRPLVSITEDRNGYGQLSPSMNQTSSRRIVLQRAVNRHRQFYHPSGDHLTLLNVFNAYSRVPRSNRRDWCKENFLQARGLWQASDVYKQLKTLLTTGSNFDIKQEQINYKQPSRKRSRSPISSRSFYLLSESKAEDILKSLCQGFFVNAAKLTSASLMTSALENDSSNSHEIDRNQVWVTLKDGLLVRHDIGTSSLLPPAPEYVIFNEAIGSGTDLLNRRRGGFDCIGTMRVVSRINRDWIADLLPRLSKVDLRRLSKRSATACTASESDTVPTLFKVQTVKNPIEEPEKSEDVREAMDRHRNDARQRYLERKQQRLLK